MPHQHHKLSDDEAALLAIETFIPLLQPVPSLATPSNTSPAAISQTEASWEVLGILQSDAPFIEDIQALYRAYDKLYFCGFLQGAATLEWSARMTLCAGTCELVKPKEEGKKAKGRGKSAGNREEVGGGGGERDVKIKLSEPLLKFRSKGEVVDTLLHEAIHAYLFVAGGRHVRGDDPAGHGSGFRKFWTFFLSF